MLPVAPPASPRLGAPAVGVALAFGLAVALGAGCVHQVVLESHPIGAYVSVGETRVGVTPLDVPIRTFGPHEVTVELVGYRTLPLHFGLIPPRRLEVRLVPEHGGAGTWDPSVVE